MSYRNLRRQQRESWAKAERLLEEASGKPYRDFVELLPIPAALTRLDLAPLVRNVLETVRAVQKTGARLYGCACTVCDQTWDALPVGPALALALLMPEAQVCGIGLICTRCARRPDCRERAVSFLRDLYRDDPTMRETRGPGRG
jgi:hypothetical protein